MSEVIKIIELWAKPPMLEHEDYNKCGLCLKEKIRSQVANEYLQSGKLSSDNLSEMIEEIERRWKETELYKRVKALLETGKTIEQISKELAAEGIDI